MTDRPASSTTLNALAGALQAFSPRVRGDGETPLRDLTQDSRQVEPGLDMLFAARAGETTSGERFIADAVSRGAVALLAQEGVSSPEAIPSLFVKDARRALGFAAEHVHGEPSRQLSVVGITGTNGKTTTASLVVQALRELGHGCGQLGTLGFDAGQGMSGAGLTTPEADVISRLLARSVRDGASHFVMEVSSHALVSARVDALSFDVAAFTNLSQDHLDFHASMQEYAAAKARLFLELQPRRCVINADDAFGQELLRRSAGALSVGRTDEADVALLKEHVNGRWSHLRVRTPSGVLEFETSVVGAHNTENILLAIGILCELGVDLSAFASIAPRIVSAPGRLERCDGELDEVAVFVDYAHTPDALERALRAVRPLTSGTLWCVFGCGGDRDRGKRPLMGAIAERFSDRVVVTSDNPRTEEPDAILDDIRAGMSRVDAIFEVDRKQAIHHAIIGAAPGDLVLLAGKGHEDYQILGTRKIDFDDRSQARAALLRRREAKA